MECRIAYEHRAPGADSNAPWDQQIGKYVVEVPEGLSKGDLTTWLEAHEKTDVPNIGEIRNLSVL